MVEIRTVIYAKFFNTGDTPIIELVGEKREEVEKLIPFLVPTKSMPLVNHPANQIIPDDGRHFDEIHQFDNLIQNNNQITQIAVRDGVVECLSLGRRKFKTELKRLATHFTGWISRVNSILKCNDLE